MPGCPGFTILIKRKIHVTLWWETSVIFIPNTDALFLIHNRWMTRGPLVSLLGGYGAGLLILFGQAVVGERERWVRHLASGHSGIPSNERNRAAGWLPGSRQRQPLSPVRVNTVALKFFTSFPRIKYCPENFVFCLIYGWGAVVGQLS